MRSIHFEIIHGLMTFNSSELSRAQVSIHSKQRVHSGSSRLRGTSLIPIEHSMSQRPQLLH